MFNQGRQRGPIKALTLFAILASLAACGADKNKSESLRKSSDIPLDGGSANAGDQSSDTAKKGSSDQAGLLKLTFDKDIKPIFVGSCATCHNENGETGGAPKGMQFSAFGKSHGSDGVALKLADIKTVIENGSMPPGGAWKAGEKEKVLAWIAQGADENDNSGPTKTGNDGNQSGPVSILAPANPEELPVNGMFNVKVGFTGGAADALWGLYYSTDPSTTSGGFAIRVNMPRTTTEVSWNTKNLPNGTYYLYAVLKDAKDRFVGQSQGSIKIDGSAIGTPPKIIAFRIPAGTGSKAWNTMAVPVMANIGDVVRMFNDDSMAHRLHTNGSPCGHQPGNTMPGSYYDCVIGAAYDSTKTGGLYDHNLGGPSNLYMITKAK